MTNKPLILLGVVSHAALRGAFALVLIGAAVLGFAGSASAKPPAGGPNPRTSSICDAISGNLVTNCGFETGNFTGWTTTGPTTFFGVGTGANSGTRAVHFGSTSTTSPNTLSQSIPTVAGDSYLVSFFLRNASGSSGSHFTATFGSNTLLSMTNPASFPFTEESRTVVATGSSTTFTATAYHVPSYFYFDDVSVVPSAAATTPEPATLGLLVLGLLGGVGFAGRKRRN